MPRLLVTGSRYYQNRDAVERALLIAFDMLDSDGPRILVQGGAHGADSLSAEVAREQGWEIEQHKADWENLGRKAGALRNITMLDTQPDVVIGFPDAPQGDKSRSRGTWHCLGEAERRKIPTWTVWEGALTPSPHTRQAQQASPIPLSSTQQPGGNHGRT